MTKFVSDGVSNKLKNLKYLIGIVVAFEGY